MPQASAAEALLGAERVLVLDTISWRPHLETSMEIALVARERGARVRYANLRAALPAVEDASWLPRALDLNALRVRRALPVLQAAGVEVVHVDVAGREVTRARTQAAGMLRGCADLAGVRALRLEGFPDVGWSVLSSVVDVTRSPYPTLREHRALFEDFLAAAIVVHEASARAMREFSPQTVVLFNGRFATTRGIVAAAARQGARVLIHDRGCDREHYWLATEPIHDPDYLRRCIVEFWRPELAPAGEEFFRERRAGVLRSWHSFTKQQTAGRIPAQMQEGSRWAVFFTSSEDEFVAIGDKYANPAFPAQADAVRAVARAVRELPGWRLCVRMHPNIASKSPEQVDFWRGLDLGGGVLVTPQEQFDSYAMLDRADVVCSYGSTVGIEATYWGKPSLLTGRAIYDGLGATRNADSPEAIRAFLAAPVVFPKAGALMYGAFFARFGTPYRFYRPQDLFRGRIAGRDLDSPVVRALRAGSAALRAWRPRSP